MSHGKPRGPIRVSRAVQIPDPVRLERYRHTPELGPRVLFFSGGSGLRAVSRKIIEYTHHSRHIITPFDSGGSSAKLRRAFRMPAVGDLRNRLMALADQTVLGNPEIYELFKFRFPDEGTQDDLVRWLGRMVRGRDPLVQAVPEPMRTLVRNHIGFFQSAMPEGFDLRGAAIGNLVLAGGYLNQGRTLDPVLYLFSQLVEVRGVVRPVVDRDLHLVAELDDGREIVGQHRFTGRGDEALPAPIRRVYLSRSRRRPTPVRPPVPEAVEELIRNADLICFPVGSFYSSVVATLLPDGVADAIAETDVPKVYVPNPGHDPEELGLELGDKVERLVDVLRRGTSRRPRTDQLLDFVLLDPCSFTKKEIRRVRAAGIQVLETPLVDARSKRVEPVALVEALLSLA